MADGKTLRNKRQFVNMALPGKPGLADGIRADVDGNIWAGAGRGGPGYDGVHVFTPAGERIGMIVLPEICANICFGGTKRQSPVHGGQPVDLRGICGDSWGPHYVEPLSFHRICRSMPINTGASRPAICKRRTRRRTFSSVEPAITGLT